MALQEVELKWTQEEHNVIVDGEVVKLKNVCELEEFISDRNRVFKDKNSEANFSYLTGRKQGQAYLKLIRTQLKIELLKDWSDLKARVDNSLKWYIDELIEEEIGATYNLNDYYRDLENAILGQATAYREWALFSQKELDEVKELLSQVQVLAQGDSEILKYYGDRK